MTALGYAGRVNTPYDGEMLMATSSIMPQIIRTSELPGLDTVDKIMSQ